MNFYLFPLLLFLCVFGGSVFLTNYLIYGHWLAFPWTKRADDFIIDRVAKRHNMTPEEVRRIVHRDAA